MKIRCIVAIIVGTAGMLIAGLLPAHADDGANRRSAHPAHRTLDVPPLRILAVGDSITAGCTDATGGWCAQFKSLLDARSIPVMIDVAATSGADCGGIATAVNTALNAGPHDLVIINCGTNNVPNSQATRDLLGQQWRTLVENAHAHGTLILPVLIQYSDIEVNNAQGRSWLVPGEVQANDTLFGNWHYYDTDTSPSWFAGKLDLQQIPGDRDYTDSLGIHPNTLGKKTYGALTYRALRAHYGWPDDVPQPCGMWGHRPDPAYLQYVNFTSCTSTS